LWCIEKWKKNDLKAIGKHINKKKKNLIQKILVEKILQVKSNKKKKKNLTKGGRKGVSAEAYGKNNKRKSYVPKIYPKSSEQITRIKNRILNSFIFNNLEKKDINIVIDAMQEKILHQPNEYVIRQGEQGDCLYVVEHGELDCFKKFSMDTEPKYLKTYSSGESFGELALLYNAPRAASIRSKTSCVLWSLDRETFNNIVKQANAGKMNKYMSFLKSVEILCTLDEYELSQICDSLKICSYKKNDYVMREGEAGDIFYIIEEGTASAFKIAEIGKAPVEVKKYEKGDYFGELALLEGAPRKASILATSDLQLLSLDRISFKRLMGPLEDILKRNSGKYEKFVH